MKRGEPRRPWQIPTLPPEHKKGDRDLALLWRRRRWVGQLLPECHLHSEYECNGSGKQHMLRGCLLWERECEEPISFCFEECGVKPWSSINNAGRECAWDFAAISLARGCQLRLQRWISKIKKRAKKGTDAWTIMKFILFCKKFISTVDLTKSVMCTPILLYSVPADPVLRSPLHQYSPLTREPLPETH